MGLCNLAAYAQASCKKWYVGIGKISVPDSDQLCAGALYRYRKLLVAWKDARPPPASAEEASALLLRTLQGHHNVHVQVLISRELL
jgi:hypothetical protein